MANRHGSNGIHGNHRFACGACRPEAFHQSKNYSIVSISTHVCRPYLPHNRKDISMEKRHMAFIWNEAHVARLRSSLSGSLYPHDHRHRNLSPIINSNKKQMIRGLNNYIHWTANSRGGEFNCGCRCQ